METVLKKSFSERWKEFKDAYFAWARYNPYHVYEKPNKKTIYKKTLESIETIARKEPWRFYCSLEYLAKLTTEKIYIKEMKKVNYHRKKDKAKLREIMGKKFFELI